ncbi:hypothetical protein AD006_30955 (plasmid) [Pseudonocardia sp. EC080610-09]|nr:hypothetical protein AD006_30955 [Pseudonocardia sp. EC080610-09]ALL85426.1 hypothetical protein AD017_30280 [Pseudonocardia sp. EC080619-01]
MRELTLMVVPINFQRRNLLAGVTSASAVEHSASLDRSLVDLRRVWSGRTEHGTDWHPSLIGGHTLAAGATGMGEAR